MTIALEAWTVTGQLLQPTSKPVSIDCDAEDYVTPFGSDAAGIDVVSDANVAIGDAESDGTSTEEQSTESVS